MEVSLLGNNPHSTTASRSPVTPGAATALKTNRQRWSHDTWTLTPYNTDNVMHRIMNLHFEHLLYWQNEQTRFYR